MVDFCDFNMNVDVDARVSQVMVFIENIDMVNIVILSSQPMHDI